MSGNTIGTAGEAAPLLAMAGGLFVLLGLPMWMGLVRRNWIYGARTPTSMASDENWKPINRATGRVIVGWGSALLAIAALVARFDTGTKHRGVYTALVAVPVVAAAIHMTIAVTRAGRRARQ